MNEIESKRKELEEEYQKSRLFSSMVRLEMFNLGVEMARKEFLDWLLVMRTIHYESGFQSFAEIFKNKIDELKQSLGEKT